MSVAGKFPQGAHRDRVERRLGKAYSFEGVPHRVAVFLLFTNRCGSTFVASEMAGLGYAGIPSPELNFEFFNHDTVINACIKRRIATFGQYLNYAIANHSSPSGIFLSKLSIDQLVWLTDVGVIGKVFTDPLLVHVERNDVIAQAVSTSIALQTGEWTSLHRKSDVTPRFDPMQIMELSRQILTANAWIEFYCQAMPFRSVRLVYEDLVAAPATIRETMEPLLGVRALSQAHHPLPVERQSGALNGEWREAFRRWLASGFGLTD